jgi:hypothetical protein
MIKTVATDTPGGKRNLKTKIKAQQMTFKQDITKYKIYWLTFRCIVHNIFRAIKLIYKRVLYTGCIKKEVIELQRAIIRESRGV